MDARVSDVQMHTARAPVWPYRRASWSVLNQYFRLALFVMHCEFIESLVPVLYYIRDGLDMPPN